MKYKKYDYRREFLHLDLVQLKKRLKSLEAEWNKWFVLAFADKQANEVQRKINYVKTKIEKLENK